MNIGEWILDYKYSTGWQNHQSPGSSDYMNIGEWRTGIEIFIWLVGPSIPRAL